MFNAVVEVRNYIMNNINDFFANTNIFITGGTGFIGKVLIEKLLRSQNNINKIYILIRSKKGQSIEERVKKDIFDKPLFDRLKCEEPNYMNKIVIVDGDIGKPMLGLNEENRMMLSNEVHIVYHCAASLNMATSLKYNVQYNTKSALDLLEFCRQMKNLKSVVMVSTAYCNCKESIIEEKLYGTSVSTELVVKICQEMDDNYVEQIAKILLDGYPNTYVFTKVLMENGLSYFKDLPIVLFRPAMVMGSYSEPVPGWIDNLNGPIGFIYAAILGILRLAYIDRNVNTNWVPVDLCVNALICSAWHGAQKKFGNDSGLMIYNFTCNKLRRTLAQYFYSCYTTNDKLEQAIWKPFYFHVKYDFSYYSLRFILHTVPAVIVDVFLRLLGKKMRLKPIYNKLHLALETLSYFGLRELTFKEDNTNAMWQSLSESEKKCYPFDSGDVDYNLYITNIVRGMKLYLAKEKLEDNDKAIRKHKMLNIIHYTFLLILGIVIMWVLFKILF